MNQKICFYIFSLHLFLLRVTHAQIIMDGLFDDWQNAFYVDDQGDNVAFDIEKLWITNDENFLYLRIDTDLVFDLQEDSNLRLAIDMDNHSNTGIPINGIGAELIYNFRQRSGQLHTGQSVIAINHSVPGIFAMPSFTSNSFEIAVLRTFLFNNIQYNMSGSISIYIENDIVLKDKIPNGTGGVIYNMDNSIQSKLPPYQLDKPKTDAIRILSYNVENDGLFDNAKGSMQRKIIQALNPDIIAFQEIYFRPSTSVAQVMNSILPLSRVDGWYHAKVNPDIVTVSKYPILAFNAIDGNGVFLIDIPGEEVLVLYNLHLPCCNNNEGRRREIDKILATLRDGRNHPAISFSIPEGSPVIIAGDLNLVGDKNQYLSLRDGKISNPAEHGSDFLPDWGKGSLNDASPIVTSMPATITWYDPNSSYMAGKLDYFLYTSSVAQLTNSYALSTESMTDEEMAYFGFDDPSMTTKASDHLPLVADFVFSPNGNTTSVKKKYRSEIQIIPNPAENIIFISGLKGQAGIQIFNGNGQLLLSKNHLDPLDQINISGLNPGKYLICINESIPHCHWLIKN
ncbi:MAG TPA: endonuclease/exonuclease/phosphatase family protein [Saprospiraceae bacterium]|nr:endonuclease/exonuclease/phosphatase family protein [Saprospiraceae bacterium]